MMFKKILNLVPLYSDPIGSLTPLVHEKICILTRHPTFCDRTLYMT